MDKKLIFGFAILVLFAVVLEFAASATLAQTYPDKSIRFIVPFPPGGGADIVARIIGQKLTESLGQPVVIDNRPGAAGNIGTEMAAKAPPDGYTILMGTAGPITINPSLYSKLPYDPVRDFAPVIYLASTSSILVVHPSVPAKSVNELIALAKSKPGQLDCASGGVGSPQHLALELFKNMAELDIVHIPYKGATPALTDLLGGHVSLMFANMLAALPHVKAGKLRALGVTSAKRSILAPDLPTIAEAGLPGFEVSSMYGVLVPVGTPKDIITKLNSQILGILHMPDVKEILSRQGAEVVGSTPEEFGVFIKEQIAKWAKVIKNAGIRIH